MSIINTIRTHFGYLFTEDRFEVYSETHFEAFSNWEVILRSRSYWLKFLQDRGEIQILLASNVSVQSEMLRDWYNLDLILFHLSKGLCDLDKVVLEFNNSESQLAKLATIYKSYSDSIRLLLDPDNYELNRPMLMASLSKWQERQWEKLQGNIP